MWTETERGIDVSNSNTIYECESRNQIKIEVRSIVCALVSVKKNQH